ncbi:hypothetical protein [Paenibacillus prosopidis]|nr:hypothetical protein [Paenibacillus prosopidis]
MTMAGNLSISNQKMASARFCPVHKRGTPGFTLKIFGTEGEFIVTPRDGQMFQMDRLNLSFAVLNRTTQNVYAEVFGV